MKKRLKINGVIMTLAFILVAVFPGVFLRKPSTDFLEEFLEIVGVASIFLGQIIRVSSRGYKAEHSQNSQALIRGGPYAVVRNPMYLGILLIGLGVVLMVFNWWVAFVFFLVFGARYIMLIFKEEKKLLKMFPGIYNQYCAQTPRLIPRISSIVRLDISEYLPVKLPWFKKEIGSISALLFLVMFVESWEDIWQEGVVAYLKESVWLLFTVLLFALLVIFLSKWTNERNESLSDKS